jgi:signal transduction histidine kinase
VFAELHRNAQQLELLNTELRGLSGRLLSTQDEERRRIARDLHDGLGQELSAAKMLVDGIHMGHQSVEAKNQASLQASGLLERVMQQVRSISHLLHPPLLDEIGLQSALRWYLDGLTERSGIETVFDVDPPEFPRLAPEVETTVFRIVQEALTNVFRHSGAMKACITLTKNDHQVAVSVRDFGKGIAGHIVELRPGSVGIGLGGMRQRAKEFGGELRLKNADPGTLIEVTIPLKTSDAEAPATQASMREARS